MLPMAQSHALLFACLSCELRRALSSLPNLGSHHTVAFTGESSHFPQRPAVQLDKIDKRGIQEQRQSEGKWLTCSQQLPARRGWWQSQGARGTAMLRLRPSLLTGSRAQRGQTPRMPLRLPEREDPSPLDDNVPTSPGGDLNQTHKSCPLNIACIYSPAARWGLNLDFQGSYASGALHRCDFIPGIKQRFPSWLPAPRVSHHCPNEGLSQEGLYLLHKHRFDIFSSSAQVTN